MSKEEAKNPELVFRENLADFYFHRSKLRSLMAYFTNIAEGVPGLGSQLESMAFEFLATCPTDQPIGWSSPHDSELVRKWYSARKFGK